MMRGAALLCLSAAVSSGGHDVSAQELPRYDDSVARALHIAATEARSRVDERLLRYTAVIRQRMGVSLRMPLKDRSLYRSEAAHRLFWRRDTDDLVQVLASREQTPAGVNTDGVDLGRFGVSFDPMKDRLFFGMGDDGESLGDPGEDDFWFEHPLRPQWAGGYRFSSGDTIAVRLPDGRSVLAVELEVLPKVSDVHRMAGTLWIEPESGSLVRAVYRLSEQFDAFRDIDDLAEEEDDDLRFLPGMLKPITADLRLIAVDYGLWEFEVWLPRTMRIDLLASAGIMKLPITLDFAYEMESVTLASDVTPASNVPEVRFRTRSEAMAYLNELAFGSPLEFRVERVTANGSRMTMVVPGDGDFLANSPALPPPVWEDAPGFATEGELREMFGGLSDLATVPGRSVPPTVRWGLQRPDLVRYNRVEALSMGVRGQLRPAGWAGQLALTGTARLGVADREPNAVVTVSHEGLTRRWAWSAYSQLAATDEQARHLGIGNSLSAAFFGRDDGDYFRTAGTALEWGSPSTLRRSYRFRLYAEHHRTAEVGTDFALFRAWSDTPVFRSNFQATEGWDYGGLIEVTPWWGSDPTLPQFGLELLAQAGSGSWPYGRSSIVARGVWPLTRSVRLALEGAAGTVVGDAPPQRLWRLGGVRSLRGYAPSTVVADHFTRARIEVARTFTAARVGVFADIGWAGVDRSIDWDRGLRSIGIGTSLLDGIIRLDGAYALDDPTGFRLDFYLDGIL
jgi:hypothetical protein